MDGTVGAGIVDGMQLGAEVAEARRAASKAVNDLAQAVTAGQLSVPRGDELRPGRQPADPELGAVLFDGLTAKPGILGF